MGESRTELIGWVNELLQLNYTKVEQCGTGGAYCQIMDSIYGASTRKLLLIHASDTFSVIFSPHPVGWTRRLYLMVDSVRLRLNARTQVTSQ